MNCDATSSRYDKPIRTLLESAPELVIAFDHVPEVTQDTSTLGLGLRPRPQCSVLVQYCTSTLLKYGVDTRTWRGLHSAALAYESSDKLPLE